MALALPGSLVAAGPCVVGSRCAAAGGVQEALPVLLGVPLRRDDGGVEGCRDDRGVAEGVESIGSEGGIDGVRDCDRDGLLDELEAQLGWLLLPPS